MTPLDFKGATYFGEPRNWNKERDGVCETLPVNVCEVNGIPANVSYWEPSQEERRDIYHGKPIRLIIYGQQPVVWVDVAEAGQ